MDVEEGWFKIGRKEGRTERRKEEKTEGRRKTTVKQ